MKSIPIVARHNFYGQVWRELECGHWQQEGSGGMVRSERRARCKLCGKEARVIDANDLGADLKLFYINAAAFRVEREMVKEGGLSACPSAMRFIHQFGHSSREETAANSRLSEFVTRCLKYINWKAAT